MNVMKPEWKCLKQALKDFADILRCNKCCKVAKDPVSYVCEHFYCSQCVRPSETTCHVCHIPSQANEISTDRLISVMVDNFYQLVAEVMPEWNDTDAAVMEEQNTKSDDNSQVAATASVVSSDGPEVQETVSKITNHVVEFELQKPVEKEAESVFPLKKKTSQRKAVLSSDSSLEFSVDSDMFSKPLQSKKQVKVPRKRKGIALNPPRRNLKDTVNSTQEVDVELSLESTRDENDGLYLLPQEKKRKISGAGVNTKVEIKSRNAITCNAIDGASSSKRTSSRTRKTPVNTPENHLKSSVSMTKQHNVSAVSGKKRTNRDLLEKQNVKGETQLHVACLKGNVEQVRNLLGLKANPNTKDFAGWTPLHEAALNGHLEIAKLLLDAQAFVNVPGANNSTPLHEAVIKGNVLMARLLVSYGANIHACASDGRTPLHIAGTVEMKDVLLTTKVIAAADASKGQINAVPLEKDMILYGATELTAQEKSSLMCLGKTLKVKVHNTFGHKVTHFIAPSTEENTCPPSMEVISAILCGIWILNRDWITLNTGQGLNNESFELSGVTDFKDACAPKRSRLNTEQQLPGLLNGCHFYLTSNASYKMEKCSFSKAQLSTLIKYGGGKVLSRQPNPESIPQSEMTVPYHASRTGALASTSHFIIYCPGRGEPELKYNMKHCKTLTVEWLINCFLNWKLIDP